MKKLTKIVTKSVQEETTFVTSKSWNAENRTNVVSLLQDIHNDPNICLDGNNVGDVFELGSGHTLEVIEYSYENPDSYGDGGNAKAVFKIDDTYWKVEGYCSSYDSPSWEFSQAYRVEAEKRTVTDWVKKK